MCVLSLQPGDKILKVSASFGNDIWEAINYGQVMYAIKTRNGQVYMKLQSNGGDRNIMLVSQIALCWCIVSNAWICCACVLLVTCQQPVALSRSSVDQAL